MNTNQELQEALYELCQATMKVMRIAYNGTIPAELVSDSVRTTLQHLVNITDNVGSPNQPISNESAKTTVQTTAPTQVTSAEPVIHAKQIQEIVYGFKPICLGGAFMWTRLSPDEEGQRYKITKYTDGTADFELIKLSGEALHSVWNSESKSESIPASVVSVNGNGAPTDGSSLVTIEPGKGKVQGSTVIVESPCVTEIKN